MEILTLTGRISRKNVDKLCRKKIPCLRRGKLLHFSQGFPDSIDGRADIDRLSIQSGEADGDSDDLAVLVDQRSAGESAENRSVKQDKLRMVQSGTGKSSFSGRDWRL